MKEIKPADLLSDNHEALNRALTSQWMRLKLSISRWDDRVRSDILTEEVKRNHGVTGNKVGDFYKRLFGDARGELDALNSALSAVRTTFYDVTKKVDRDYYIVPVADMPDVLVKLTAAVKTVDDRKNDLRAVWPMRVAQAQAQLGSMADALEYPNIEDVLSRMEARFRPEVIGDLGTLDNMLLPTTVAATFASQMANNQTELVTDMVTTLYDELAETTADMARYFGNKVAGEKGHKLYDSKIEKVKRLARQLESASGIVNTDFSNLSAAVSKLAEVDFDAAKASITVAEATHTLASDINKSLGELGKGDTQPVAATVSVANTSAAEVSSAITDDAPVEQPVAAVQETTEDVDGGEEAAEQEGADNKEAAPQVQSNDMFADLDKLFF